MLGAKVDHEPDGVPGASATGDDAAGVDDEDALALALDRARSDDAHRDRARRQHAPVRAATLYGWIDANGNGTFQACEAATVAVPNGATSATLSWTGLPAAVDGAQPVVRLRLTSATLTDTAGTAALDERSQGAAPDGEVEDSLAAVAAVLPNDCTNPFVETFGAGPGGPRCPPARRRTSTRPPAPSTTAPTPWSPASTRPTAAGGTPVRTTRPATPTGGRCSSTPTSSPGKFFSKSFTGLQVGSKYDFSAWITNANNAGSAILPNIKFRVVDPTSGAVLSTVRHRQPPEPDEPDLDPLRPLLHRHPVHRPPGAGQQRPRAAAATTSRSTTSASRRSASTATRPTATAPCWPPTVRSTGRAARAWVPTVDYEGDGQPTAAADGDDTNRTDDEDGVARRSPSPRASRRAVDVNATNTTARRRRPWPAGSTWTSPAPSTPTSARCHRRRRDRRRRRSR